MQSVKVYAKVNLSLGVGRKKGDRHLLDMIAGSFDSVYDEVSLSQRTDRRVTFSCTGGNIPQENSAVKLCRLFMEKYNMCGADIHIKIGIPAQAGLGGSSADAAGVAVLMQRFCGQKPETEIRELCTQIGSDVYYMTKGGMARLTGYGELIENIKAPDKIPAVVAKPVGGVSTAQAFSLFERIGSRQQVCNDRLSKLLTEGDFTGGSTYFKNQLYEAALRINPEIETLIKEMRRTQPIACVMSGSGSAVVGIYPNIVAAESAQKSLTCAEFIKSGFIY